MKKRIISLTLILFLAFSSLSFRIYLLGVKNIHSVSTENTKKSNTIATSRGNVYDTNFKNITNAKEIYIACIKPTAKSFIEIERLYNKVEIENELKKGKLITTKVPEYDFFEQSNDILTLKTFERYDGNSLCHILGYCNGNTGMYGIEKHYNSILAKASGSLTLKYHCDALGRVLNGEAVEVNNDNYNDNTGIVLTIDKDIQKILEEALINYNIDVGCGIVLNAETSEILACASTPIIDRKNLDASLKNENSPFINRAFSGYAVGSVFKIVTAAAALENNNGYLIYECTGSITKSDNIFNCNKLDGHKEMDLENAITYSCNPYFIELACNVGSENLVKTAKKLGFNKKTDFGNGYITDKGNLPSTVSLNSDAAIGNLGFGQGELLATPLQIANCYATIANGGYYNEPSLIKGFIDKKENFTSSNSYKPKKVLKTETCEILKDYLLNVVNEGTGTPAFTSLFKSCGKTATAETGQLNKNNEEIRHSWYVGFFPYENPKYVICIMKENGISGSSDCAPVFKEVAEAIYILNKVRS